MSSDVAIAAEPSLQPAKGARLDLQCIAEALIVRSATAYLCLGELRELALSPPVIDAIERELYTRFYVRPALTPVVTQSLAAHRDLMNALSAANTGAGTWEPGWHFIKRENDGRYVVSRDGVCFWTEAGRVRLADNDAQPGEFCRVFVVKELRYLVPGFYYAIGDEPAADDRDRGAALTRIYWNLTTAEAALAYITSITGRLNKCRIAFRTKVLSDASAYGRADSGVLYLDTRDLVRAWPIVADTWRTLRNDLGVANPMFTLRLADGIGIADDPGDGRSFGQSRCAIVAEGLWAAFAAGENEVADRIEHLRTAFRHHGLDPDRPHLNAASTDYDMRLNPTHT